MNKEILCKCLLERNDEILVFTNFTSLVLISTMIVLLVILFKIKLHAPNNTFKEKFFKFFSNDVQIRIMIENEIYCYVNGFLKWNISKKTSYVIGNKKLFFGKICILNLRNKRKSIFARVIIRN